MSERSLNRAVMQHDGQRRDLWFSIEKSLQSWHPPWSLQFTQQPERQSMGWGRQLSLQSSPPQDCCSQGLLQGSLTLQSMDMTAGEPWSESWSTRKKNPELVKSSLNSSPTVWKMDAESSHRKTLSTGNWTYLSASTSFKAFRPYSLPGHWGNEPHCQ